MKFKGDHLRSGKKNVDKDPWVELGPIVWISRLVGQFIWSDSIGGNTQMLAYFQHSTQYNTTKFFTIVTIFHLHMILISLLQGPGGTIINISITIMAIIEATISFSWILFVGHHSKNTLSRVTEDGQVLILYLSASWSALNAVLWREDDKIMALLKGFPLEGKYNPWNSYKKIALKLILLAPVTVSIWLLSRELVAESKWAFTAFYLPLVQMIFAQLQMTTVVDILTRRMVQLTQDLSKCVGIVDSKLIKTNSQHCYAMEQTFSNDILMEVRCKTPPNLYKANGTNFDREKLVNLISGYALLLKARTLVNSSFGLQTLVSLGRTFLIVTFNFFLFIKRELIKYIQTGLNLDFIAHSFYLLAMISIHLIELWSLVSSADNFSKSAETFTRNLFTAAIEDDTEILAEMDVVKSHIASSKDSTITAFGFLSVDYSLICGMLGAITTYMVIIVQIGNVEE